MVRSAVAPSINTTVPLGVPAPGETALTATLNTTDWPKTDGLVEEVRPTLVSALLTVWVSAEEVLVLKLASPL